MRVLASPVQNTSLLNKAKNKQSIDNVQDKLRSVISGDRAGHNNSQCT